MPAGEGGILGDVPVALVASGSAPGNATIALDTMTVTSSNLLAYATYKTRFFRTLILKCSMAATTSLVLGDTISIHERGMNMNVADEDGNIPDANFDGRKVGYFNIDPGQVAQICESSPILVKPYDVEYLFKNNAGEIVSTGWSVEALHHTYTSSQA